MNKHTQKTSDEELLGALAERLSGRRGALQQASQVLAEMRTVNAKLEAAERLKAVSSRTFATRSTIR